MELSERLPAPEKYLIHASHARIVNDTDKAIAAYENLAKASAGDSEVHFELAALYEASGAFDQARAHYKKALEHDPKYVAALLASGRVEIKAGNPQGSLDYLNQALSLAIQLGRDEEKADVLHAIGAAYKGLDKPSEALRYYQESLEIKRRIGQKRGIAVTLGRIAQVQERLGNMDDALASYKEALQIQREIGDKKGTGLTLIDLGDFYSNRGNYDQALQDFKEALQIQRDVGNQDAEGLCLNNIGNVYLFKTQYDDAQTYFERALQIREKTKDPGDIADTLHNLAETATNKGQYEQALKHYLRALELRREAGDKRWAAIESYSMGTLFEYEGKYGAALGAKEDALKAFRELQDGGFWMVEILSGTGHSQAMLGRSEAAQTQLVEALKLAEKLENKALTAQILNFQGDRLFYLGEARAARPLLRAGAPGRLEDRRQASRAALEGQPREDRDCRGTPGSVIEGLTKLAEQSDSLGLKSLSVESTVLLGQALIETKRYPQARQELERALAKSEKLGLRRCLPEVTTSSRRPGDPPATPPTRPGTSRGPPDPRRDPEGSEDRRRREAGRPRPDPRRSRLIESAGGKKAGPRGPAFHSNPAMLRTEPCRSSCRTPDTGRRTTGPAPGLSRPSSSSAWSRGTGSSRRDLSRGRCPRFRCHRPGPGRGWVLPPR